MAGAGPMYFKLKKNYSSVQEDRPMQFILWRGNLSFTRFSEAGAVLNKSRITMLGFKVKTRQIAREFYILRPLLIANPFYFTKTALKLRHWFCQ